MAVTFSGTSDVTISATYANPGTLTTPAEPIAISKPTTWTASNANRWYKTRLTFVASTPQSLDLYGSLTDSLGNTLSFATIRQLTFENRGTTGQNVTVTGNFMTGSIIGASGSLTIPPGVTSFGSPTDGYAVTNTTKDTITITPGAYVLDVDVMIIGVSA